MSMLTLVIMWVTSSILLKNSTPLEMLIPSKTQTMVDYQASMYCKTWEATTRAAPQSVSSPIWKADIQSLADPSLSVTTPTFPMMLKNLQYCIAVQLWPKQLQPVSRPRLLDWKSSTTSSMLQASPRTLPCLITEAAPTEALKLHLPLPKRLTLQAETSLLIYDDGTEINRQG